MRYSTSPTEMTSSTLSFITISTSLTSPGISSTTAIPTLSMTMTPSTTETTEPTGKFLAYSRYMHCDIDKYR